MPVSSRPTLPPPRHAGERVGRAVQQYLGLQRGAQISSRTWWGLKIIQGVLLGGALVGIGSLLMLARPILGGMECITGLGPLLLLAGFVVAGWNILAPVSTPWRVTIPAGEYWVVENRHGAALRFLPGGPQRLDWQMNLWLRPYVDFTRVQAVTRINDVLPAAERRIDIEITVLASFQPHNAPPDNYVELRKITRREAFERMIQRVTHNATRSAFQRRQYDYDAQLDLLYHPDAIAQIVHNALRGLGAWGLFVSPDSLPDVILYGLPSQRANQQRQQQPHAPDTPDATAPAQRSDPHDTPPHGSTPPESDAATAGAPSADVSASRRPTPGPDDRTPYSEHRSAEDAERRQRRRQQADPDLQADHASEDPMDRRRAAKARRRQQNASTPTESESDSDDA